MKKESFTQSLPFRLLVALAVGIAAGLALSAIDGSGIATALLNIIVTVKFISSQFINFCVPLIIIGFIAHHKAWQQRVPYAGCSALHRLHLLHRRGVLRYRGGLHYFALPEHQP